MRAAHLDHLVVPNVVGGLADGEVERDRVDRVLQNRHQMPNARLGVTQRQLGVPAPQ